MRKNKKANKALEPVLRFLNSAWYWEKKANRITEDIARLRSRAEKVTTSFSPVPPSSSYEDSRQNTYDAMIDKQREYEAARRECEKRLQEIRFFIGLLDDYVERTVCEYRYLSYYEWLDVGIALNYSLSALQKINDSALENLLKINEELIRKNGKGFF
jgi:hypothetical protein